MAKSLTRDVLNIPSAARSSYSSGQLNVGDLVELAIDFNVTAVTSPITFIISRVGTDGILYEVTQTLQALGPRTLSVDVGAGLTANASLGTDQKAFGDLIQVDLQGNGTFSGSIKGK